MTDKARAHMLTSLDGFCMVLASGVSLFAHLTYALSDMVTIWRNYFFGVCGVVASARPADLRGGGGLADSGRFQPVL